MMNRVKYCLVLTLSLYLYSASLHALSLEQYLDQVRNQNEGYSSEALRTKAAAQRSDEGLSAFAPELFADANFTSDGRPTLAPAFQGNKTLTQRASIGVKKLMDFGMRIKLYQSIMQTELVGVTGGLVPSPRFLDTGPALEIEQPLLRNGFGHSAQASLSIAESSAMATKFEQSARLKQRLAQAEQAYWALAFAYQALKFNKEMLASAKELLDWVKKKASLDLADRADKLQTESSYRLRLAEVESAEQSLRAAARAFNSARGIDSHSVSDPPDPPDAAQMSGLQPPARSDFRDDVIASQHQSKIARARSELSIEANRPSLDLKSTLSLTGRDNSFGSALGQGYSAKYPYFQIGLTLTAPLDFERTADTRDAYRAEVKAAELDYSRKLFEQGTGWNDLIERFESLRSRYKLTVDIESAQKTKTAYEQARFKQGRTTTFFVVQYEQEYLASRLQRARLETELLQCVAQMKTYGDTYESR